MRLLQGGSSESGTPTPLSPHPLKSSFLPPITDNRLTSPHLTCLHLLSPLQPHPDCKQMFKEPDIQVLKHWCEVLVLYLRIYFVCLLYYIYPATIVLHNVIHVLKLLVCVRKVFFVFYTHHQLVKYVISYDKYMYKQYINCILKFSCKNFKMLISVIINISYWIHVLLET